MKIEKLATRTVASSGTCRGAMCRAVARAMQCANTMTRASGPRTQQARDAGAGQGANAGGRKGRRGDADARERRQALLRFEHARACSSDNSSIAGEQRGERRWQRCRAATGDCGHGAHGAGAGVMSSGRCARSCRAQAAHAQPQQATEGAGAAWQSAGRLQQGRDIGRGEQCSTTGRLWGTAEGKGRSSRSWGSPGCSRVVLGEAGGFGRCRSTAMAVVAEGEGVDACVTEVVSRPRSSSVGDEDDDVGPLGL